MKVKQISVFLLSVLLFCNGCSFVIQKGRRSDLEEIESLREKLNALESARAILERQLRNEIKDKQVKLEMKDKGLVITVLAEVLFDSGKDVLRKESYPILDKVANILKKQLYRYNIGIEGHTDNQPIKHSGWKSNWELSAHRALSVLYYLEKSGVNPVRLSAVGHGEYKPVVSNSTKEGQQMNRRVEIIVLPQFMEKLSKKRVIKPVVPRQKTLK